MVLPGLQTGATKREEISERSAIEYPWIEALQR
jgi:hypothetical protein